MHNMMVGALALNPAVDLNVELDELHLGAVNQSLSSQRLPGGKGVKVALALARLGVPTRVAGRIGAADGVLFRSAFAAHGIEDRSLYLPGHTRINTKIFARGSAQCTEINTADQLPSPDAGCGAELLARLLNGQEGPSWVALSGSLPAQCATDTYAELIRGLDANGISSLLDSSGSALAAGLSAAPHIAKPNLAEFESLCGPQRSRRALLNSAQACLARRWLRQTLVVSLGAEGALFVDANEAWFAAALPVATGSAVGAGDAMVAGILAAQVRGFDLAACARLASASAAAALGAVTATAPASAIDALAASVRLQAATEWVSAGPGTLPGKGAQ